MCKPTALSDPALFWSKFLEIKATYIEKLCELYEGREEFHLTHIEIQKIVVIIALLETPKEEIKIPPSMPLLQALEAQICVWVHDGRWYDSLKHE